MSDSTVPLSIFWQHRTIHLSKQSATLVQALLEDACKEFKIADVSGVRLVLEKGEKAIDHSLTIKLANIKAATKLAIIAAPANRSQHVQVTLQWRDKSYVQNFPVNTSLFDILKTLEKNLSNDRSTPAEAAASSSSSAASSSDNPTSWTEWHGIPPVEKHSGFELHINLPGYMQPVLEIGPRRIQTNDDLKSISLLSLGLASSTPAVSRIRMKLTHSYVAPKKTAEEQKAIVDNFQKKYAELTGGNVSDLQSSSSTTASSQPQRPQQQEATVIPALEEEEDEDIDLDDESDTEEKEFQLPDDRRMKLFHALPGLLPAPELPEEFYEVSHEDSLLYAQSIRKEALKYARENGLLQQTNANGGGLQLTEEQVRHVQEKLQQQMAEAVGKRGTGTATEIANKAIVEALAAAATQRQHSSTSPSSASSSSSSSQKLLDSSRLPPVPSASERRNARIKRACKAVLLRVRLPNHLYAEALFRIEETPRALYEWMDSLLEDSVKSANYYLYISPPRQVLARNSNLTFKQLQLFPQAIINFGTESRREQQQSQSSGSGETTGAPAPFVVPQDTPEQIEAQQNPGRNLLRTEFISRIVKIEAPPVVVKTNSDAAVDTSNTVTTKGDKDVEMKSADA